MTLVDRYILRNIAVYTGLVMLVLVALAALFEFVSQFDDVGTGNYGIPQALLYVVLKLPRQAFSMLPMATLLGALLGLGNLATNSELIVMRTSGMSLARLAGSCLMAGLVLMAVGTIVGEYIAPPLDRYARQFRTLSKHDRIELAGGEGAWVREGESYIYVSGFDDDFSFGGVLVFRTDEDGWLESIGRADAADVDEADRWVLTNLAETRFGDSSISRRLIARSARVSNVNPELLNLTAMRSESLDAIQLYRYAEYLKANGLNALQWEVAFWNRLSSAFAIAIMCVLALPFVFGPLRSTGAGTRMVVGILVGVAYFLASRSLADGGQLYRLNSALVAWLPTVGLLLVTGIALWRAK